MMFEVCVKLTTIAASSFSTTTLDSNNIDEFPDDIISDHQPWYQDLDIYYDWNICARTKDVDGQLLIFTVALMCLKWSYMKQYFTSSIPVVNEIDVLTGLPLFILTATSPTWNIESVYNLVK